MVSLDCFPLEQLNESRCLSDDQQMGPNIPGLSTSDVRRHAPSAFEKRSLHVSIEKLPLVFLSIGFRCHPDIVAFANKQYYQGSLGSAPSTSVRIPLHDIWPPSSLVSVDSRQNKDRSSLDQTDVALVILVHVIDYVGADNVVVMTPYLEQSVSSLFSFDRPSLSHV